MVEPAIRSDLSVHDAGQLVAELAVADARQASALMAELIRRFEPLMRRIWDRVGGSHQDYSDFRQNALLKLWRKLPQLKEPAAFPGFFRQMLVNEAYDALRRTAASLAHEVPMDETIEEIPDEAMDDIDIAILVRSNLERLPPREREVLQLELVDGLTPTEIARRWGVSDGAVRMTKSRAINKLRDLLA